MPSFLRDGPGAENVETFEGVTIMNEYMFGVSREKLSRKDAKRYARVAGKHGFTFVEAILPGEGYKRWFAGPNRGHPFDGEAERAIRQELGI